VAEPRIIDQRYDVVRPLGAGGAGELLLVEDRHHDAEPCALKILRPRERDPGLVPLFREEFLLLAAIDHPAVVKARNFGVLDSGEPYFTMDYLPGENARSFVAEDRLEPVDYIDFASQILGALARVHGEGILHRDIKPENIIMRRDEDRLEPVLVDFGLAADAAGSTADISGTLPYIAPEVLGGAIADARADLFAFGLVLFEVCTGRRPGERGALTRDPQRTLAPDRVKSSLNRHARGSVPKRFEEFVVRLLAAHPSARYPSARAALEALASIYQADIDVPPEDLQRPPPATIPPLVGRRAATEAVMQRIEALHEGKLLEPVVVVAAPSGFGVTRLLHSLRHQAAAARCAVFQGHGLLGLYRSVMQRAEGESDDGTGLTAAELVFRIDAFLHEAKLRNPPVLLLDDVDRADDAEVEALRDWVAALERRRGRARVLLVLAGCSEGESEGADLLRHAGRAVPHDLRDLAPLSESDIRSALSILLGGAAVPGAVTQAIHRASGGSPRAFAEMLGILVDGGVLQFTGEGPRIDEERLRAVELPTSVIEVARSRSELASPGARAALARFSLLPNAVTVAAARIVTDDALPELLQRGLLVRDGPRVGFPYEVARRAHDDLEGSKRGEAQLEMAGRLREEFPEEAAQLYAGAGSRNEARAVGLAVAERLIGQGRNLRAKQLLRSIAGDTPDEATAALYMRSLLHAGSIEDAASYGLRMLKTFDSTALAFPTASALLRAGRPEEALDLLDVQSVGTDGMVAARFASARSAVLAELGDLPGALDSIERAALLAGGEHQLGGRIASNRGRILRLLRRNRSAVRLYRTALDLDLEPEARRQTLVNLAAVEFEANRLLESFRHARAAATTGSSAATPAAAQARHLQALIWQATGRLVRCQRSLESARRTFQAAALADRVGAALVLEASALLHAGRPAEGEARLARAETLPGAIRDRELQSEATVLRAMFHLFGGAPAAARRLLDDVDPESDAVRLIHSLACAAVEEFSEDLVAMEAAWRRVVQDAVPGRKRIALAHARVALAKIAGARGAWRLAEQYLDRGRGDLFALKTPLRARALMLRATAALHREEPGAAGRFLEESIATANRTDDAPLRAELYATAASLLEEPSMQRYLREPTATAAAALLEVARDIWAVYGNETMLRKIDLHLSELPRPVTQALGGPESDRLVKVLHIAREMNREFDRDRLLGLILDRAIELTGAERGFVILLEEGREQVRLARNIDREAVSEPEQKVSSQIIREVIDTGRIVRSEDAEYDAHFEDSLSVRQLRLKSIIAVPFRSGGRTVGALYLDNRFRTANFTDKEERLLELFADQAVVAIDRTALVRELAAKTSELAEINKRREREIKQQGKQLARVRKENRQHRKARGFGFERIIVRSVAMKGVIREAKRLAESDLSILITGENGTGKELIARALHYGSRRQSEEFVAVNCAAFAEGLLEAELFGHVRGSFSGADRDRPGLFEEAHGGTLFLDEVGEMSMPMQVKLLRALELGEVRRIGENDVRRVDVRVLSATNSELEDLVRTGRFREDLMYRVSGSVLTLPPLRDRLEDVEPLALSFVEEAVRLENREPLELGTDAVARLESYAWPGNVRELRNVVLRAVVSAESSIIGADDIVFDMRSGSLLPGFDSAQAERILEELSDLEVELNSRQQGAIGRALTHGKLSFAEYQRLFRVSKSTTSRDLEQLLAEDLLQKRGKTRATIYLPGARLREIANRIGLG
jgi:transcriptional regulator with GAF, ATPase, and Fis domain